MIHVYVWILPGASFAMCIIFMPELSVLEIYVESFLDFRTDNKNEN